MTRDVLSRQIERRDLKIMVTMALSPTYLFGSRQIDRRCFLRRLQTSRHASDTDEISVRFAKFPRSLRSIDCRRRATSPAHVRAARKARAAPNPRPRALANVYVPRASDVAQRSLDAPRYVRGRRRHRRRRAAARFCK